MNTNASQPVVAIAFYNWSLIVFTFMNFSPQLQQKIEKWASSQGISTEEFVLQAMPTFTDASGRIDAAF